MQRLIRFLAVLAAALMLLSSCTPEQQPIPVQSPDHSGEPAASAAVHTPEPTAEPSVRFINGLGSAAAELYVSPAEAGEWGDTLGQPLPAGEELTLPPAALGALPGVYDIGVLDENGINYDAFGVTLAAGDELLITGDYANGVLTVTKQDGSRDFYDLKVYYSPPEPAPASISIDTAPERFTVQSGGISVAVERQKLTLSDRDAALWPGLAAALAELDDARREALTKLAQQAAEAPAQTEAPAETGDPEDGGDGQMSGSGSTPSIREKATVYRSDTAIVSILFEIGGSAGTRFASASFDPAGKRLFLSDIVNDVRVLPHLANVRLAAQESRLEINEYRDHTADFSADSPHYAFAVSENELLLFFNTNAFRSGVKETARVSIRLADEPFLLKPAFLLQP
ncbi:MAG: hypothetical protein IKO51_03570 [Clostridia bacterium]|nr:hypothetical protein [Clostridia bacterium]